MIVIGADTHKRTHALAAVDNGTGRLRGAREITASEVGHIDALRWARGLDEDRVWAIEDCRPVSRRLEQALIAAGERVVRVAPHRMGASRRGERKPGKSDEIDAQAVARAVVKDGVDAFPAAHLDEDAMQIRLLSDHRSDLVAERTRMQNRLRWHLVALAPELEASVKLRALDQLVVLDRIDRRLRAMASSARVRVAREELVHIRRLTRQITTLERELRDLVKAHRPVLLAETGCGPMTAAILIGRTAGAERFKTDASFARQAASRRSRAPQAKPTVTDSTAAATASSTARYTRSRSRAPDTTLPPRLTSPANRPKARPNAKPSAASNATSPGASTTSSPPRPRRNQTTVASSPAHPHPCPA
jgi:transposase